MVSNAITTGGATSGQEKNVALGPCQVVEALGASAAGVLALPPRSVLLGIFIQNLTANAITGGLDIGTTLGGAQVVSAQAVAASTNYRVADTATLIANFPTGGNLYFNAHTAWNSASINLIVVYALY